MDWFQHPFGFMEHPFTGALFDRMGHDGLGVFWRVAEFVARQVTLENLSVEYEASIATWSRNTGIHHKTLRAFARHVEDIVNIYGEKSLMKVHYNEDRLVITVPMLIKSMEDYAEAGGYGEES